MRLLSSFRKKRAIKSYIEHLPKILAKDYGRADYYSQLQVRCSIERSRLNPRYEHYALAMYARPSEFMVYQQEANDDFSYEALRTEIGEAFFNGNNEFNCSSVMALSSSASDVASSECSAEGAGDNSSN
ncbi:DUF6559 family protein [Vreelandella zhanjiangensis]|uniref:DUF6559 family protein n=1 Tax=Vreelandella zhanjiangensis TaxID=1121960 RepID=UPI00402AAF32